MATQLEIDIVGGGFSGLMQAYYLAEAGYKVRIYETDIRFGGLIGSVKREGFLIEQGPNAFIANTELERISKKIKVPLYPKLPSAKKRFIYKNGEMSRWPIGLRESFGLFGFLASWKWRQKKYLPQKTESLKEWGDRCLGETITDNLLEPAMQGVYASSADKLNAHLIVSSLKKKSKVGRLKGSVAPKKGLQEWLDGVIDYLKSQDVEFIFEDYFSINSERPMILACGLESLKELAKQKKINISDKILQTSSASLTSVFLGFNETPKFNPEGFGCLFPRDEKFNSLGVLFNQNIFSERVNSGSSETWILNDETKSFSEMTQDELIAFVLSDRSKLSKGNEEPTQFSVHQWPHRIPLYDKALLDFLETHDSQQTLLIGNYLGDLGLSKILSKAQNNVKKIEGGFFG